MKRFEKYKESVNKYINNDTSFCHKNEWKPYLKYINNVDNYLSVTLLTFVNNLNHTHKKKILGYNCACTLNCIQASEIYKIPTLNLISIYSVMDYQSNKQLEKTIISHLIDLKTNSTNYGHKFIIMAKLMVKLCWGLFEKNVPTDALKMAYELGIMLEINEEFTNKSKKRKVSLLFEKEGVQKMHELFMESKATCIKYALKLDLLTSTFQEILDDIQSKIDNIMEHLSTDS